MYPFCGFISLPHAIASLLLHFYPPSSLHPFILPSFPYPLILLLFSLPPSLYHFFPSGLPSYIRPFLPGLSLLPFFSLFYFSLLPPSFFPPSVFLFFLRTSFLPYFLLSSWSFLLGCFLLRSYLLTFFIISFWFFVLSFWSCPPSFFPPSLCPSHPTFSHIFRTNNALKLLKYIGCHFTILFLHRYSYYSNSGCFSS